MAEIVDKIVKPNELRNWREAYGYTQKDLAKILGTSPGCIQSWEVGRRTCPPTLYWALKGIVAEYTSETLANANFGKKLSENDLQSLADLF